MFKCEFVKEVKMQLPRFRFTLLAAFAITTIIAWFIADVLKYRRFNQVALAKIMSLKGKGYQADFPLKGRSWLGSIYNHGIHLDFHYISSLKLGQPIADSIHRIDDNDLREILPVLAKSTGFKLLGLRDTEITDASLADFPMLRHVECLDLRGTEITDDCVGSLAKLQSLRILDLNGTRLSLAAVMELRATLAGCNIQFNPSIAYVAAPPRKNLEANAFRYFGVATKYGLRNGYDKDCVDELLLNLPAELLPLLPENSNGKRKD